MPRDYLAAPRSTRDRLVSLALWVVLVTCSGVAGLGGLYAASAASPSNSSPFADIGIALGLAVLTIAGVPALAVAAVLIFRAREDRRLGCRQDWNA